MRTAPAVTAKVVAAVRRKLSDAYLRLAAERWDACSPEAAYYLACARHLDRTNRGLRPVSSQVDNLAKWYQAGAVGIGLAVGAVVAVFHLLVGLAVGVALATIFALVAGGLFRSQRSRATTLATISSLYSCWKKCEKDRDALLPALSALDSFSEYRIKEEDAAGVSS